MSEGDQFLLEIAPAVENVRTARLFGAGIARHYRCDEEQVEDLKLALSEAVNRALRFLSSGRGAIRVLAVNAGKELKFSVEGLPVAGPPPGDESDFAPSEGLILALFPDAVFGDSDSSTRFTVALP